MADKNPGIHYIDRWVFSMIVCTTTLLFLMAVYGIPHHIWLDLLHMWFTAMAINNLRLMSSRNRKVG